MAIEFTKEELQNLWATLMACQSDDKELLMKITKALKEAK